MKYILLSFIPIFNSCLYINEVGLTTNLYDKCYEYYDSNGSYHKECDETLKESVVRNVKDIVNTLE
jgi:hypothetical protein